MAAPQYCWGAHNAPPDPADGKGGGVADLSPKNPTHAIGP